MTCCQRRSSPPGGRPARVCRLQLVPSTEGAGALAAAACSELDRRLGRRASRRQLGSYLVSMIRKRHDPNRQRTPQGQTRERANTILLATPVVGSWCVPFPASPRRHYSPIAAPRCSSRRARAHRAASRAAVDLTLDTYIPDERPHHETRR